MGRPPLAPGEKRRASMGFRPLPGIRENLERAARANGWPMSREIEERLGQSFKEDEAFGGMQFRALFGLLANAASLIEQQTGRPYFEDWHTSIAVRAAWRRLITGFGPSIPAEEIAAFEQALALTLPKLPIPPALPGLSLGAQHQYEQQCKDYDAALVVYEKESAVWNKEGEALRRLNEVTRAHMDLGKDIAVSLLPERPKKKA